MSTKLLSKLTKFEIMPTTGGTWTKISGIKTFAGLHSGSTSIIDTTDLDSLAKEKLPGLADEGALTLTGNYIPADAGQLAVDAARELGTVPQFRVTLPNATTFTFAGIVVSTDKGGGVDQVVSYVAKIEISGQILTGVSGS